MRKYSIAIVSSVSLALLCAITTVASPRHADTLTVNRTIPMPFTLARGAFAEWTGGDLVVTQDRFSASPTLTTFDSDGKEVSKFVFTIPGAGLINIYDNSVALGKDGSLAIVGTAYSNDSRGAAFVAWLSPDRGHQTLIRSTSFFPEAVVMPSDGTIWVSGYNKDTRRNDRNHEVMRRYDRNGNLLGSVLPLSNAKRDSTNAPKWRLSSILISLGDRVGWYLPSEEAYVEFSLDGSLVNRFKGPPYQVGEVISLAACQNGNVFAATKNAKNWGVFSLRRERGDWTFIPREQKWGLLLGCDGTHLVSITDFNNISWLETSGN
ncbi:MAG TPA: hypothetical protein VJR26_03725 [Candidatus Acidoferrales bacterium]|nr:hypothetical protein [Candidatus Acidoferrales bacterium]